MNWLKAIVLLLLGGMSGTLAHAQSYLYIQGDKNTPIYVKLEGEMLPRLGMNYCIIPDLEAGDVRLEILFQGNAYPAHKFVVTVPENSSRGLILTKVGEQKFALYDMYSQAYIAEGNTTDEAYVALRTGTGNWAAAGMVSKGNEPETLPEFRPDNETPEPEPKVNERFLEDVDLNKGKTAGKKSKAKKREPTPDNGVVKTEDNEETAKRLQEEMIVNSIPNTDCSEAMDTESFQDYADRLYDLSDDEAKLKYVRKSYKRNCFNTEQVGMLADLVKGQSSRLELVQTLYPKVVDQGNYKNLESLFTTDFMKEKFRELIK